MITIYKSVYLNKHIIVEGNYFKLNTIKLRHTG